MNNLKVLLINPPIRGHINAGLDNVKVPLGLAYIAAYIREKGFDNIKILDAKILGDTKKISEEVWHFGMSYSDIEDYIKNYDPDIIGVHCAYTVYSQDALKIAEIIKKINKKIIVVFGGAHVCANPESVLNSGFVDISVIGEGEITFYEILKKFQNKESLNNIRGIAIIKNKKIKINPLRPLIQNLDDIPFPARDLLDMQLYFNHPQNSIGTMRSPATDVITSRGCPFNCVFCSIHTIWGKHWRGRSAKNVVDEIELLIKTYGIKQIRFQDDNISLDKKRMYKICDEIINRKLNIKWDTPNGIAIWTLNEELLRKMKKSGYYRLAPSIESGSCETIKFINKPIDYEHVNKILKLADKIGLWTVSPFIIGFPYETLADINKTINFAKKSRLDFAIFYIAQPYAGTKLYDIYKKEGLLKEGVKHSSSVIETRYNTKHFSAKQLDALRTRAYREFYISRFIKYLNPINIYYLFKKIGNYKGLKHTIKMVKAVIGFGFHKK
ncbi:MAG: B12-binding domain-containing radical SAM protein [Nanoarchaeota archaeon]|nr:B12-binding domain-containing radical SAM protein [Nanoarchaeota archaeon]